MAASLNSVTASVVAPLRGAKRWAYLDRARTIRVATTNEDGSIYLSPLWHVVHEDTLYLPIDAGARHAANLDAGRPMAALVDAGDEFATVAGVRILGSATSIDDPDLFELLQHLVRAKYFHVGHPYGEAYFEFGEWAGRRYYRVETDKLIGWDSRETTMPQVPESRALPAFVTDRPLRGTQGG